MAPFLPSGFELLAEVPSPLADLATSRGREPRATEAADAFVADAVAEYVRQASCKR